MAIHTTPDSYTKLLIHSDTADGSTTFVDSSASGRTFTIGGSSDITHATAQSKFGKSAIYRPTSGNNKNIYVGDYADLTRTTDDFTVECWVYMTALNEKSNFLFKSSSWWLNYYMGSGYGTDNKFNCMFYNGAAWQNATNTMTPVINTWYHVAGVVSSNELTLYVDGVGGTPTTLTGTTNDGEEMGFGGWAETWNGFQGYLDEIRISKGIARWTDSFVPPNKPYSVVDDDFVTDVAGIEDVGDGRTTFGQDIIIKSNPDEASTDSVFSASAKDGTVLMDVLASGKTTVKGRLGAEGSTSVQKVYRIPHPDGVTTFTHTVNVESTLGGWRQGGIVQLIVKCYQTDYWYGLIWWTNNGGGSTNLNSVTEVVLSSSGITVDATVGSEANDIDIEFSGMHDNNHGYINNIIYDIYDVLGD